MKWNLNGLENSESVRFPGKLLSKLNGNHLIYILRPRTPLTALLKTFKTKSLWSRKFCLSSVSWNSLSKSNGNHWICIQRPRKPITGLIKNLLNEIFIFLKIPYHYGFLEINNQNRTETIEFAFSDKENLKVVLLKTYKMKSLFSSKFGISSVSWKLIIRIELKPLNLYSAI